jgi:hypothetical protein
MLDIFPPQMRFSMPNASALHRVQAPLFQKCKADRFSQPPRPAPSVPRHAVSLARSVAGNGAQTEGQWRTKTLRFGPDVAEKIS